ncbi:MAG: hypothetical protein KC486_10700 [Myxococcales bacterium]|nr:hypothetical protein [Myxococcales bacterium]
MPQRRSSHLRASLTALALPLALSQWSACNCNKDKGSDDPELQAIEERMPGPKFAAIDAPDGFLDGGMGYAAFRPGPLQKLIQSFPLPPDAAEELAKASRELGVDLRTGDVLSHFGIDPDGVVSMTLGRPILGDGEALLDELANIPPPKPDAFPAAGDAGNMSPQLASKVGAIGFHFRIHVPITTSERLAQELARIPPKGRSETPLCQELQPHALCAGDEEVLLLARALDKAMVVDVLIFPARTGALEDAERRPAIDAALKMTKGKAPVQLRGDAAAFVDASVLRDLATVVVVSDVASAARWSDDVAGLVERKRKSLKAVDRLRETRRLLRGVRYELAISDEAIRTTYSWEPTDDEAAATLDKLLTHQGLALPSPTIDGLCSNSLMCFRAGGLPSLPALGELATGVYAGPPQEFGDLMRDADELGAFVLLLETWPNALGASDRWAREEIRGPEAAIANQVMNSLKNFAGAGASLRSVTMPKGMGVPAVDFAAYGRVTGTELGIVRGALALAQQRMNPITVDGVDGKVESLTLPEDVPAALYLVTEAKTRKVEDREVEVGWMVAADGVDRLTWLLGLGRDEAVEPAAYFEIPDLMRLLGTFPEAERELGSFRAYLTGRSVRISFDVIDGSPRFDAFFGRTAPPAAADAEKEKKGE